MLKNTGHFDNERWVDFVRHVISLDAAAQMQSHLDEGCDVCGSTHAMWLHVVDAAAGESCCEPPEASVQSVKAAFALRRKLPVLKRLARMAQVVFDSLYEPLPVGVRGGALPARHILHEAGLYFIDVRLERESEIVSSLIGQVLPVQECGLEPTTAGILLVESGQTIIAQTITNSMGEFKLECDHRKDLTLYVDIAGSAPIGVTVPQTADL
jgi:hypothetical protein